MNALLVELVREHDGDEYGMLYLSQDTSKYYALTGSNTSKIVAISACDNEIDAEATYLERKRAELLWKVKINNSKLEAAAGRGAKQLLLATFDASYTNTLKYPIKLHAGVTYLKLVQRMSKITASFINETHQNY